MEMVKTIREEIAGRISKEGTIEPEIIFEIVTPEVASEYLERNIENLRALSEEKVRHWCRVLERGEWITTHQGVAFDLDGVLFDGQHRLTAIVRTQVAVTMAVGRNLPRSSRLAVDQGYRRTMQQATGIHPDVTQVIALLWEIKTGDAKVLTPSLAQILSETDIGKTAWQLHRFCSTKMKVFSCAAVRSAAVLHQLWDPTSDYAFEQYRALVSLKTEDMSPYVARFRDQADRRRGNVVEGNIVEKRRGVALAERRSTTFARALKVLDENLKNKSGAVVLTTDEEARILARVVKYLRKEWDGI